MMPGFLPMALNELKHLSQSRLVLGNLVRKLLSISEFPDFEDCRSANPTVELSPVLLVRSSFGTKLHFVSALSEFGPRTPARARVCHSSLNMPELQTPRASFSIFASNRYTTIQYGTSGLPAKYPARQLAECGNYIKGPCCE